MLICFFPVQKLSWSKDDLYTPIDFIAITSSMWIYISIVRITIMVWMTIPLINIMYLDHGTYFDSQLIIVSLLYPIKIPL